MNRSHVISQLTSLSRASEIGQSAHKDHLSTDIALATDSIHECLGDASHSLALSALSKTKGKSFWIGLSSHVASLRAQTLRTYSDVERLICVETSSRDETLWAAEQALRCKGAELVILHLKTGPDLFESRRLQISAKAGQSTGIICISRQAECSAAQTRWQCEYSRSSTLDWNWSMTKNKRGRLIDWSISAQPAYTHTHPKDLLPRALTLQTNHANFALKTSPRAIFS